MKLTAGERFGDGRYVLRQQLGNGGMASVWLADDERLERPVAIKVVAEAIAADELWLERFEREARAAASLSHPNIVQLFDYDVEDDLPYLVMEYVSGGSLAARLTAPDARPVDVHRLGHALLSAVGHIHAAGILHRDIKPENVLLDLDDRARLTDFGIAHSDGAEALTSAGMVIGTLRYLAPEVAAGAKASVQSDLYATGVVLRAAGANQVGMGRLVDALTAERVDDRPASAAEALDLLGVPSRDRTSATAVHPAAGPTREVPAGRGGIARWQAVAATATLALIALVVAIALTRDNSSSGHSAKKQPPSALSVPSPSAPLPEQLHALDRLVTTATAK